MELFAHHTVAHSLESNAIYYLIAVVALGVILAASLGRDK